MRAGKADVRWRTRRRELDRSRMARRIALEIGVESRSREADERLARAGDANLSSVAREHPVPGEIVKLRDRLVERGFVARHALRQRAEVEREVAHQPFDGGGAQAVIVRNRNAAHHGDLACLHHAPPARDIRRVLHEALRRLADGRCAHADQRIGVVGHIPLKIAPQKPCARGDGERVCLAREVVEPDGAIAFAFQFRPRGGGLRDALGGAGKADASMSF